MRTIVSLDFDITRGFCEGLIIITDRVRDKAYKYDGDICYDFC